MQQQKFIQSSLINMQVVEDDTRTRKVPSISIE